jgi:hypothetical protein
MRNFITNLLMEVRLQPSGLDVGDFHDRRQWIARTQRGAGEAAHATFR